MKLLRFITNSIRAKVALMIFSLTALLLLAQSANTFVAEQNRGDAELLNHIANLRVIIQHVARLSNALIYDGREDEKSAVAESLKISLDFFEGTLGLLSERKIFEAESSRLNLIPFQLLPIRIDPQFLNRKIFERQLDEVRIKEGVSELKSDWKNWKPMFERVAARDTELTADDIEIAVSKLDDRSNMLAETISSISNEKIDRGQKVNLVILLFCVFLTVLFYISIRKIILEPIENLRSTAEAFSKGDTAVRAETKLTDEIGALAITYNKMMETVLERLKIDKERLAEIAEKNQELEKASKLKSQFLANMSHELRTPMNSIIGYSEVLLDGLDGDLSDEQRDDVDAILRSAEHLLKLINEILDLSKIEAGHMKVDIGEHKLAPIIDEIMTIINPQIKKKGLSAVVKTDDALIIRADRDRIKQIIMNLVSNAVKFTDHGSVSVTVSRRNEFAVVEVRDTGIGIPKEEIKKIFEEFHQADGKSTRKYGGTGLGLTIARRFSELMGGRIEAESEDGKGSIFRVFITMTTEKKFDSKTAPQILIVEDDPDTLALYNRHLESAGINMIQANSIADALNTLESSYRAGALPKALIADLQLPDGDGRELIKTLKKDSRFSSIEIGVISIEDKDIALEELGVKYQVVKPVNRTELIKFARNLLGVKKMTKRILVIEDHPENAKLVEKILTKSGYEFILKEDAISGLEALKIEKIDLLLLDISLPGMDGIAAAKKIREELLLKELPIIALTAHAMDEDRRRALDAGCNDYMTKPFRPHELISTIKRYLDE
ncbi:MAG: hypothetical protein AUJ18_00535 [Candidatus Hydrogenedentes bacterium CG1_02_42_14]|nr:MAG: hypothetical protein AUJ18_00535 [Candidatus Hydrogenedentes bacterium CG1_02_42_14]